MRLIEPGKRTGGFIDIVPESDCQFVDQVADSD